MQITKDFRNLKVKNRNNIRYSEDEEREAKTGRERSPLNYHGKGVLKAVGHVDESLGPELLKQPFEVTHQTEIDEFMIKLDSTENKFKFGANAILRVSLAVAKAGVAKRKIPLYKHLADLAGNKGIILPVPAFNVINTGSHAGNKLAMQEFMILPTGIKAKFGLDATAVGDEGGFPPNILNNKDALMMLLPRLVTLNVLILVRTLLPLNSLRMVNMISPSKIPSLTNQSAWLYEDFIKNFPIVSIEDLFDQDDWDAWTAITPAIACCLRLFRTPSKIIDDASRNFTAKIFKNFVEQLGIEIHVTTPGTHRSDGQKIDRLAEQIMESLTSAKYHHVQKGCSPFKLVFGQEGQTPQIRTLFFDLPVVTPKLRETSERQKRMFDIKRRDNQSFEVGDFVLLRPEKFSCEFVRPYRIKSQATGDRYLPQKVRAQKVLKCSKDLLRVWPTD
ncbi:hypothetical protein ILUMI_13599 [Ignelater luminosus]|uniref:Enolase n=1 Tax=Ignelater luminosus TaxID=2038154 RepID=A0A8K0GAR7_IGNLU|nr:hypothetical protein ILUMI_13599 [Ignelater luminosus]